MIKTGALNVWAISKGSPDAEENLDGTWTLMKVGTICSKRPIPQQKVGHPVCPEDYRQLKAGPTLSSKSHAKLPSRYACGGKENIDPAGVLPRKRSLGLSRRHITASVGTRIPGEGNGVLRDKRKFNAPRKIHEVKQIAEKQSLFAVRQIRSRATTLKEAAEGARAQALGRDQRSCTEVFPQPELRKKQKSQSWNFRPPPTAGHGRERVCSPQNGHGLVNSGQEDLGQPLIQFASGKHVVASAAGKARAEALLRDTHDDSKEVYPSQETSENRRSQNWNPRLPATAQLHPMQEISENFNFKNKGQGGMHLGQANPTHEISEKPRLQQWKQKVSRQQINSGGTNLGNENSGQPLFQLASGKHVNTSAAGKARAEALLRQTHGGPTESCVESRLQHWNSRLHVAGRQPDLVSQQSGHGDIHTGQICSSQPSSRDRHDGAAGLHPIQEASEDSTLQQWNCRQPPTTGYQKVSPSQNSPGGLNIAQEKVSGPLFQFASGKPVKASAAGKARAEALLRDSHADAIEVYPSQEASENVRSQNWDSSLPVTPEQQVTPRNSSPSDRDDGATGLYPMQEPSEHSTFQTRNSRQPSAIKHQKVSPPQNNHGDLTFAQDNSARSLFQFASGKDVKASAAGKVRAEALLRDKHDGAKDVCPSQEASEDDRYQNQNSRLPVTPQQQVNPRNNYGGVECGQEHSLQPHFQFASGKPMTASAAGKARAEALLRDGPDEGSSSRQETNKKPRFHWTSHTSQQQKIGVRSAQDNREFEGLGQSLCPLAAGKARALLHVGPIDLAEDRFLKETSNKCWFQPLNSRLSQHTKRNGHRHLECVQTGQPLSAGKQARSLEDWNTGCQASLQEEPNDALVVDPPTQGSSGNPWKPRLSLNARKPKVGASSLHNSDGGINTGQEISVQPLLQSVTGKFKEAMATRKAEALLRNGGQEISVQPLVESVTERLKEAMAARKAEALLRRKQNPRIPYYAMKH